MEIYHSEFREVVKSVRPVMQHRYCHCGGEFECSNDNTVLTSYPPQYRHVCNQCGKVVLFTDLFPKIEYEEVND